jgi:hypothetical protein
MSDPREPTPEAVPTEPEPEQGLPDETEGVPDEPEEEDEHKGEGAEGASDADAEAMDWLPGLKEALDVD